MKSSVAKEEIKVTETETTPVSVLPKAASYTQILVILLIVASFMLGSLYTKVQYLEKGGTTLGVQTQPTTSPGQAAAPAEDTSPREVSLDDDPVLGDPNAPVTLVEFSDYECPFCKRHYDETYVQIKKDYIDTGKVKLVYRDYPLSFHDPMATTEAIAANCARKQGGDEAYFKLHDEMFTQTTSNGTGLTKEKIYAMSDSLGLNTEQLKTCMDDPAEAEEIKKDIEDGTKSGVSATPSFFVGKSGNGKITGTPLIGAQPYTAFKTAIDAALK